MSTLIDLTRHQAVAELAMRLAERRHLSQTDTAAVCRRARLELLRGRSASAALAAAGQLARVRAGITPFSPFGGAA
jgi:hypothetical protein